MTTAEGNHAKAKQDVLAKAEALRESLAAYRRKFGKRPDFFLPRLGPDLALADGQTVTLFADRRDLVAACATGFRGAELGVRHGDFSAVLLARTGVQELHLIDLDIAPVAGEIRDDPRTVLHQGDSAATLIALTDLSFDWIYIDGAHNFAGVMRDARAAHDRLRPGGLMIFNDYTPWSAPEVKPYGVIPAVHTIQAEHGMIPVALALSPTGFHDIALRKPAG